MFSCFSEVPGGNTKKERDNFIPVKINAGTDEPVLIAGVQLGTGTGPLSISAYVES